MNTMGSWTNELEEKEVLRVVTLRLYCSLKQQVAGTGGRLHMIGRLIGPKNTLDHCWKYHNRTSSRDGRQLSEKDE